MAAGACEHRGALAPCPRSRVPDRSQSPPPSLTKSPGSRSIVVDIAATSGSSGTLRAGGRTQRESGGRDAHALDVLPRPSR